MRVETDGLGALEIPDNAYYGIQTYRAFLNFQISGTQIHPIFIQTYLILKKAAAITNKKLNKLDHLKADAIVTSIEKLLETDFLCHFIVDAYQAGAGTSQHMNVNEVVANKANELMGGKLGRYDFINPNDHVNQSQSTNDTYPTVMQLSCLSLSKKLIYEFELLSAELGKKAQEYDHVLKSARTHLQDAVPMRLGQEFKAYQTIIDQLINLLKDAENHLRILGIGGSAVGTGINVPYEFKETILDELRRLFKDKNLSLATNMCASMQSQLPAIIYSNALRATALELTKFFNDLRLLSSGPKNGFGELTIPAIQAGSSIMPGKINPSLLEMGNQVCFKVIGNDSAIAYAIQAGQLELNVMMPLMAHLILESIQILTNAIHIIRQKCIIGIKANVEHCMKQAEDTSQIATVLNPILGYAKASEVVKESQKLNQSVLHLIKERKLLTDDQIALLFDLEKLTSSTS